MTEHFTVAIIGSGPGGLSAGVTAAKMKMSHVVLERAPKHSDTIQKYQKGKKVMANPARLSLRANLRFEESVRETILDFWERRKGEVDVKLRCEHDVTGVSHATISDAPGRRFTIEIKDREAITADNVVLAIGQGVPNTLNVPGSARKWVQYQLDDPKEYRGERIVVVGAGDAGVENALALADNGNIVTLVNRNEGFACQPGNITDVQRAIDLGRITIYHKSATARVDDDGILLNTPTGDKKILCDRVIARMGSIPARPFIEKCGVEFPSKERSAVPNLSLSYETNVTGLYIIGSLGGYSLIKQAINQGFEVIHTIGKKPVPLADEGLLEKRFEAAFPGTPVVEVLDYLREHVPMLEKLTVLQLREAMLEATIQRVAKGETIYKKGDYSSSLYNIAEGEVGVLLEDNQTEPRIKIPAGEFFGETSLLSGRRRSGTVKTTEDSVLVEIPRRTVLRLEVSVPAVKQVIDDTAIRRIICNKLGSGVPTPEIENVINNAVLRTFAKTEKNPEGDILMRQGEPSDCLYIIRSGSVAIERKASEEETQALDYVHAGGMVGERGLLTPGATRSATVRATIATEAIRIDTEALRSYLEAHPELKVRFQREVQQQITNMVQIETQRGREKGRGAEDTRIIDFLLAEGMGEATNALIIDESLCVGCDNCETACAATHGGVSRLDRAAGKTIAAVHVPIACRHCEQPHCMAECPVDAIKREPSGEVTINNDCIACGKCVVNCPYHVIRLAYVEGEAVDEPVPDDCAACTTGGQICPHHGVDPTKSPPLSAAKVATEPAECLGVRWSVKKAAEAEHVVRRQAGLIGWLRANLGIGPHMSADHHKKQAVKCDLCNGISGGPACVRACPTGAAWRGSPEEYLAMVREGQFRTSPRT